MNGNTITIKTKVNKKIFRDFAVFDTLIRQKRWRAPLFFACMMLVFAAICFTQTGRIEGAPLLGGVLAGVGILLPAAYFFSFYSSIQAESRKQKLIVPQHVYTVTLSACQEGIIMTPAAGKGSRHRIRWENAHLPPSGLPPAGRPGRRPPGRGMEDDHSDAPWGKVL